MSALGKLQREFAPLIAKLILYAYECGYEVTVGHFYRCGDCKIGKGNSLHKKCLAADLNLFKDEKYLTKTEDHRFLGEYWETLHPLASWGGRFNDGNHYSLKYGGMKLLNHYSNKVKIVNITDADKFTVMNITIILVID